MEFTELWQSEPSGERNTTLQKLHVENVEIDTVKNCSSTKSLERREVIRLAGAVTLALITYGCGGGGAKNVPGPGTATVATKSGSAIVSIAWPTRTTSASAARGGTSRLIPLATNSMVVSFIQNGTTIQQQIIARPTSGSSTTANFTGLPPGVYTLLVAAFASTDGSGAEIAGASTMATIISGQTTTVNISLVSTIDHLVVTPTSQTVAIGLNYKLTYAGADASGNILPLSLSKLKFVSLNPDIATVDTNGIVMGVAVGIAQITVTDTESGKMANITATPVLNPAPAPVISTISASTGGVLSLSSGSSITIAPQTLQSDQSVTLIQHDQLSVQPPNTAVTSVSPSLELIFSSPISTSHDLTFAISTAYSAQTNLANSLPVVRVAAGSSSVFVALPGSYDNTTQVQTVTLTSSTLQILADQNLTPTDFEVSFVNTVSSSSSQTKSKRRSAGSSSAYGGRYWTGSKWTDISNSNFDPTLRTILLVHGIFSSVESVFPNPSILAAQEDFAQVIGFDYDWTQHVSVSGDQLATFINNLRMNKISIQAHSLGTVVSLSAVGELPSSIKIEQMVLLGGPLAGAPLAASAQAIATFIINISVIDPALAFVLDYYLKNYVESTAWGDVVPGSEALQSIFASFNTRAQQPDVYTVAGTSVAINGNSYIGYVLQGLSHVIGGFDGVIPENSAFGRDAGFQQPPHEVGPFPNDSHTDLNMALDIIAAIAALIGAMGSITIN